MRIALLFLTTLTLWSCQKKDEVDPQSQPPVITIISPENGGIFQTGDTVFIKGTVSYQSQLHGFEVKLEDTASGDVLYNDTQHVHSDEITIDQYWVAEASAKTGCKLSIIVYADHSGNDARAERLIVINP